METQKENSRTNLHIVMFPFFAYGHISPFVQISNKLSSHGVKISFFSAQANVSRIQKFLNPSPNTQIIPLTIPHVEGLPPGVESTNELTPIQAELLKVALDLMQPQIKNLLLELKPHFVFFDFAHDWLPKMAKDLGIKTAIYSVFIALAVAYLTVPSRLSSEKSYPDIEQLKYPPSGFPKTSVTCVKTFEARDFLYMYMSFYDKPCVFDRIISGVEDCSFVLAKTCNEMEAPYVEYMKSEYKKPVLLTGPVVPEQQADKLEEKWDNWLNQFEAKSVIYCSFGSETFLSDDQIRELALGLELTKLPFFLVLNFPADKDASTELRRAFPEGFLERVKGKGVISSGWVQQQQILAHKSVGCYLFHAGFGSIVEGLVNDCQLVMLPLKGDQFLNCKLACGDWGVGVEVNRRDEDGYFGKWDIKSAIESVMVEVDEGLGKSIRVNHKKWKDFMLDKSVHDNLISNLVKELEGIVGISS